MANLLTYNDGEPFPGVIGRTSDESSPAWPTPPRAPDGAPNVLIFVLDDVGFGQLSCFGGLVETPVLDRFAANGLRYTNMHTTALCSPSRGAILTGRNHHSLGLATIAETSTGYPGYNAILPFDKGMLSEMLLPHGYNTFLVGKWHLSPPEHETPAGPVRPLAARPRLRAVLRLPRRRHQPVVSRARLRQPLGRAARAARGRLPPEHRPGRQGDRVHPGRARQRAGQAVLPALLHRRRPRPAPRAQGVGRQVQGQVRRRLGRVPQGGPPAPARDGHHPRRDRAVGARPGRARCGTRCRRTPSSVYARMMEVYAGFVSYTDHHFGRVVKLPRGDRRARQHAVPPHLRQRRELRGRPGRLAQRDDVLQQRPGVDRGEPRADRRAGRPERLQPLRLGLDQRRQHAVPPLEAGDLPGRHHRPVHRLLARRHHGPRRDPHPVRAHHRPGADRARRARPRRHRPRSAA